MHIMTFDITKAPRLFVPDNLTSMGDIQLTKDHCHYLLTVMRKNEGDIIRLFNGIDGEFSGEIKLLSKKSALLINLKLIKEQPENIVNIHLYFAPIKKDRMAFLIEKSVELGVTHIHPIITDRTQNRKINIDKIKKQMIEASEQCERMTIPKIFNPTSMGTSDFIATSYAAIERDNVPTFTPNTTENIGIIIGPEGGWSDSEKELIYNNKNVRPTSLGNSILRAETACLFMLSRIEK